ncbi:ABC transporter permease subunit [[Mycoplasma] anseris]|uniref:ABC transporter permease subunit n=1 Tax=[Mycoplasma] anseris TaxID=92400 RepID=A0A2Z4NCP7_9BACT|nr:ABC transporter permease subunit [[Mycoplasma] anseris]AWX69329.1 ABC transporter permease subunit [[Mycoplasma] anseris]
MNNNQKSIFFDVYQYQQQTIKGKLKARWKFLLLFLFLLLFFIFFIGIDWKFAPSGFALFKENIIKFFHVSNISSYYGNTNLWVLSFQFLFYSIKIIFVATFVGALLAFLTALLTNYQMVKKWVVIPFKIIVISLRLFPELLFIYFFSISFDKTLGLFLLFVWFTWLWLHEYFSQIIENANFKIYFHLAKQKTNRFKAFFQEIWPQIKPKILNYFLYSFESNLRWSSILSQLGFLGIGTLLQVPLIHNNYYSELFIPLFVLICFFVILELLQLFINENFFKSKSLKTFKQYNDYSLIKKLIVAFLSLLVILLLIFVINDLVNQKVYFANQKEYWNDLFNPNWRILNLESYKENNFFWILFQLFALISITCLLLFFVLYVNLFFINKYIFNKFVYIIFKIINLFIRMIPILILFILINPIFNSYATTFIFAFAIHGSSSVIRNLEMSINNLEESKIKSLKKQNWTKWKIYNKFILPSIKLELSSFMTFEIEKITRNFMSYGLYNSSLFGGNMILNRVREFDDIAPYLWIGFILIAIISIFGYLKRLQIQRNYIFRAFKSKKKTPLIS